MTKKDSPVFKEKKPEFSFAFTKENYMYMIIGVVVLALGYILLLGGGSDNPDTFNSALFNTRRLIISPILIVLGLVIEVYAIMKKTKKTEE
ncbi:MAG: DUF3098 domain-containing protein [Bacteroidales bacterium]|nr:DUF3098 domain-containing protein [Bacteroidales bacterium]MBQ9311638.1 DUF3098 domain-containing protein [Bacteroidales bacterium]